MIDSESTRDVLALWGAGLSTLLGVLKVLEYWSDRFRLEVDYEFSTDPDEGNKLTVRNLTSNPITIVYKEVLVGRRLRMFRRLEEIPGTDESPYDVHIPAHSSHTFEYRGSSYFSLKSKLLAGKTIYLKVWIAGRKPRTIAVYKNRS